MSEKLKEMLPVSRELTSDVAVVERAIVNARKIKNLRNKVVELSRDVLTEKVRMNMLQDSVTAIMHDEVTAIEDRLERLASHERREIMEMLILGYVSR